MAPIIASISSLAKRFGTCPVMRIELMYSRNASSLISASVNRNVVLRSFSPALRYRLRRSFSRPGSVLMA